MTHNKSYWKKAGAIVPLVNKHELLTPVYIKTYTVKYAEGSYSHLVSAMRTAGNEIYSSDQVEAGAADGAYIKSNVQIYFNRHLGVPDDCSWFPFQWDIPHRINKCDEKAQKFSKLWSTTLDECQNITKLFRWGKEHQGLIELVEELNAEFESVNESYEVGSSTLHKFYSPVLMSDLKFAAYGHKFINNYVKNIATYI